ncbi:restriction endonuclease [bacterium]|nr:restriction endonuclease [bacterium]
MTDSWKNRLYFGDNLEIMREHISDESVDLIYLDPPFNSKATYNILFKEKNGTDSSAQITAFDDTWHWDIHSEAVYEELVTGGPKKLADLIQAFRLFLGRNDMMAYLTMMAIRLVEMHRVLKESGSIYLHCDPTASHYLKLLMDAIFRVENFRNEIIWKRTTAHNDPKRFGKVHDVLLFYTKSNNYEWNEQYCEYNKKYLSRFRNVDSDGRLWADDNLTAKGLTGGGYTYEYKGFTSLWRVPLDTMKSLDNEGRLHFTKKGGIRLKRYLDEMLGVLMQDVITDISVINSQAKERLGYPTQKPESLLERIIKASSNEGDLVLDPFCGCGTTIAVAERLHRRWIGIDITHLAIALMKHRLEDTFSHELSPYEIIGDPKDLESARTLAIQNRHQFEWWALSLVGARPAQDKRKGADKGVDGYNYFFDDESRQAKKIVVQVKSGHVTVSQVRDLIGVVEHEKAAIGAFITLQEPTAPIETEAASAGFYETEIKVSARIMRYPRIQILTIEELLGGKELSFPEWSADATHKKAARQKKKQDDEQTSLL